MPFKNSIAGSLLANPSFGQVYIDASREDLTRVAGDQSGPGAARESLPQDLETFLMEDNKVTDAAFKITTFAPCVGSTVRYPFSYGRLRPFATRRFISLE
jgi:hypothetical protein